MNNLLKKIIKEQAAPRNLLKFMNFYSERETDQTYIRYLKLLETVLCFEKVVQLK